MARPSPLPPATSSSLQSPKNHPLPTPPHDQIPIDGQLLAAVPRVRSSEAFGRRPQHCVGCSRSAGIRNPSRKRPFAAWRPGFCRPSEDCVRCTGALGSHRSHGTAGAILFDCRAPRRGELVLRARRDGVRWLISAYAGRDLLLPKPPEGAILAARPHQRGQKEQDHGFDFSGRRERMRPSVALTFRVALFSPARPPASPPPACHGLPAPPRRMGS